MKFRHEKLQELRHGRGYSLAVLSRVLRERGGLRVSRTSLNHWERGLVMPGVRELLALCEFYGVEPADFFGRSTN